MEPNSPAISEANPQPLSAPPCQYTRPNPLPLRYRIASNFLQAPLFGLATIAFGCLSLLASLFDKNGQIQHQIARTWARTTLRVSRSPVIVYGAENLTKHPVAIYAANHASYMDTPVIFASLPMQFRILARHDLWRVPFIGWHLKRSGQIPINQDNARASVASLQLGVKALKSGMPLFVFPEGGRTPDGELQPFMNGVSYIAVRAGVPIVPIALIGTYELLPIHTRQYFPRPLYVIAGEPILTTEYTTKTLDALTARVREAITGLCKWDHKLEAPEFAPHNLPQFAPSELASIETPNERFDSPL